MIAWVPIRYVNEWKKVKEIWLNILSYMLLFCCQKSPSFKGSSQACHQVYWSGLCWQSWQEEGKQESAGLNSLYFPLNK